MGLKTSTKTFDERLQASIEDTFMQKAVAKAQDDQWVKREGAREELGHWEMWRELGEQIRKETIAYLPDYLEQFSDNVEKNGGHVFFAQTEEEARDYVRKVTLEKQAKKIVKSKSMVTTEVGLDQMLLELDGVSVMETDLAEFILQMDDWDEPSHIVFPNIHKNREQIRKVFEKKLGYDGDNEPVHMARFARKVLREFFLEADIGITGCNFAIADSGIINLVTNEGNADLCISIPKTQIVLMGMERIVPTMEEAEVVDNLLSRSAVGQSLTSYVTFAGRTNSDESDGPEDFHVVIIDNGRSNALGTVFQPMLQCIRCGACLNVCPVYRHIGGHGYGSIYPGPMGAVLSPILGGYEDFGDLPYASSLCGACTDTCPVKIPLHQLLIEHRVKMTDDLKMTHGLDDLTLRVIGKATASPILFKMAMKMDHLPSGVLSKHKQTSVENLYNYDGYLNMGPGLLGGWTSIRDLPRPPKGKDAFREWFKHHKKEQQGGQ
ncbi:LutB/LldF family L-lactate oxidation iron-sulfur protein [Vagococcus entomophilus]|uniref:Iron-sulfur cluster-binding protein n=1 Tax=Vagococcus entomophilus TaxID=1160095 RepID=A0A430AGG8_9ENTE|nr:LutB/LldF family L-lactate oxidation iron-sulfur protein [Vagococcus entomophilus]RSU06991.1 iron-sulfur cluster-binding protein [Vagococcus entomophilus]